MAYSVPDPYPTAIRGPLWITYHLDAYYGGAPVVGATDLEPNGGSITDTSKPGVRRTLQSLELPPRTGLAGLLSPLGTQLKAFATVTYVNRASTVIPMGVFVVDRNRLDVGGGAITLSASDKWVLVARAQFVGPESSIPGNSVTSEIARLITGALPGETVTITATSSASVGSLTWEKDRAQAILDLAASIGAWVYFDRDGAPVVADIPNAWDGADWLVDAGTASSNGVLLDLATEISAADVCNVVVVSSSAADGEKFATQVAFDDNPLSPTYAGTDPFTAPETAGPFGLSVKYIDTPTDTTAAGALAAAQAELARSLGLASTSSLVQVPNPALDAYDAIDVRRPPEKRGLSPTTERQVVDEVTHSLTVDDSQGQQIEARKVIIG